MGWFSAFLQALPFANSAMLLWGLAASVPILIHLWSKRRYQRVTWAAMEFLLTAVRKNSRRIRIEQLILLLLRASILILLAMALADPIWSLFGPLASPLSRSGSTHHVLVLDASYSMAYRASERNRFEVARQLAAQIINDSRQGDGFSLVLMADPPVTVIGDPAFSSNDALAELQRVSIRHTGANLMMTLGEIDTILQRAGARHERLQDRKVFFFTDMGRNTWEEVTGDQCRRRLGSLAEQASLVLIDVGQTDVQNLAITGLEISEPLVTVGHPVRIEAEIENFGSRDQQDKQIALHIDGQQVLTEAVNVPASERATAAFVHRFDAPGEHRIELRLHDDPLDVDNHRWASIPVREAIRVLCVEGRPGEARHVALALEPGLTKPERVQVLTHFENVLLELDLLQFDAIFLCNLARLGRDEANLLRDYAGHGGGLVVLLGDQVQAENYNTMLGGPPGQRLLPAELDIVVGEGDYRFDPLDYQHPIVSPFQGHVRSGLLTAPVWRYFRVRTLAGDPSRTVLAFDTGDAAIVEHRVQTGGCILVTTATSPQSVDRSTTPPTPWSALSTWPSFPPLIQEILAHAVRGRIESRNRQVGEPLQGTVRETSNHNLNVTVERPDQSTDRLAVLADGNDIRWGYTDTNRSGLYTIRCDAPVDREELFAVNVDTRESDLQRLELEQLPSRLRIGMQADEPDSVFSTDQPTQYFRHVLALLLILLLVESSWAWYLGNASA
jgi:hypothetical protein